MTLNYSLAFDKISVTLITNTILGTIFLMLLIQCVAVTLNQKLQPTFSCAVKIIKSYNKQITTPQKCNESKSNSAKLQ